MEKILLGLSGGVDSAVAAYLLKEQGYDVTCCFMRNWDALANQDILGNPTIQDDMCPQEVDYQDAQAVAELLGLPLLRVDFINEYWDEVFQVFLTEYSRGRTPNPDILCNKHIKFHSFLSYAKELGFEKIATGHYARIIEEDNTYYLGRGKDSNKDQSYFLSQISRDCLKDCYFPLGELEKHEVREIAEKLQLSIAKKKDSTGICFIGERNFKDFLSNYLPAKKGDIIDIETKAVVGKHNGVLYYTLGQRKGLGIGGVRGPWFVVGKDVVRNELYVTCNETHPSLLSDSCSLVDINWLVEKSQMPSRCTAKFRYRQKDETIQFLKNKDGLYCVHYDAIAAVTPGQQVVFYDGDKVLGGATIDDVYFMGKNLRERLEGK